MEGVYGREVGELSQEIGGVGLTLLALAELAGIDADLEELRELERVLQIPKEVWKEREQRKEAAGFNRVEILQECCEVCCGKGLVSMDDQPVNAFEGSDYMEVKTCRRCGGEGKIPVGRK